LTWASVSGASTYSVLRSTDGVTFSTIASGITSTVYTDSGVSNGTLYFYKITAFYSSGNLTSPASTGVTPGNTPLAPAGLTLTNNTSGTDISLSWASVNGASSYNVYEGTASGGPYTLATTAATT